MKHPYITHYSTKRHGLGALTLLLATLPSLVIIAHAQSTPKSLPYI